MLISSRGARHSFPTAFVNLHLLGWNLKTAPGSAIPWVSVLSDGSPTLEGQFGWKWNPWLTLFFKDLAGYSVSPSAYAVVEKPNARQFPPFYQYEWLDLFAQLLKRLFLYHPSDKATRFCPFYFRKAALIVILKHFLSRMVLVLFFRDSSHTSIISSFHVFYTSISPPFLFNP